MPIVFLVAGARPNFMKIAPIVRALQAQGSLAFKIIHTGQHYDREMNDVFFEELGIPQPDVFMGAGGGSHAQQTAKIMTAFEELCQAQRPDAVLVVGDVNSTLACSIVAKKLNIRVAHVEAGLRSGDMSMPEEINRLVTDAICDVLWTPSPDADENLAREGVPASKVDRVGNIMIDSFEMMREIIDADGTREAMGLAPKSYAVVTLHRPSNVDRREDLEPHADVVLADIGALPDWLSGLMSRRENYKVLPSDLKMIEDYVSARSRAAAERV